MLGADYTGGVRRARAFLREDTEERLEKLAAKKVEFWPERLSKRCDELLEYIGRPVCASVKSTAGGAGSLSFQKAAVSGSAPLSGLGPFRVGEDGVLRLAAKSEHYHSSLGHAFPGYRLIDLARELGVLNATHNNTRGHITRLAEEDLIRVANGLDKSDSIGLAKILDSNAPRVINRVINLETGSLAVEAGVKMMLARFYKLEPSFPAPKYSGKIPVFIVMGDNEGGRAANYHGTTVITQTFRGLWPELYERARANSLYIVEGARINDINHFGSIIAKYDSGPYKVAGFLHEIILMNYGGIRLTEDYLRAAHKICADHDIPVLVDEIQSCVWYPELFLFREYGLTPDFAAVGKGFPGGEYAASKILFSSAMDSLSQFGALVTNGQEELASLAYLITTAFAEANKTHTRTVGELYESELRKLGEKHNSHISKTEGQGLLSTIFFHSPEKCLAFVRALTESGVDISAQTYKADCPPAALTKLPLIISEAAVDWLVRKMDKTLGSL
jgi:acetylornithine/succinyldiaminopimelate/putrescine aminotransferase